MGTQSQNSGARVRQPTPMLGSPPHGFAPGCPSSRQSGSCPQHHPSGLGQDSVWTPPPRPCWTGHSHRPQPTGSAPNTASTLGPAHRPLQHALRVHIPLSKHCTPSAGSTRIQESIRASKWRKTRLPGRRAGELNRDAEPRRKARPTPEREQKSPEHKCPG